MAKVRAIPAVLTEGVYGYRLECPGCGSPHVIPTSSATAWQFNGDLDRPTFSPSLKVFEVVNPETKQVIHPLCHSFVEDGRIRFLPDSGHALSGQTVDLPHVRELPARPVSG